MKRVPLFDVVSRRLRRKDDCVVIEQIRKDLSQLAVYGASHSPPRKSESKLSGARTGRRRAPTRWTHPDRSLAVGSPVARNDRGPCRSSLSADTRPPAERRLAAWP